MPNKNRACGGFNAVRMIALIPLLAVLVACAAPTKTEFPDSRLKTLSSGYEGRSTKNFAQTRDDLLAAIESRGLKVFTVIDHQKGAASIDIEIEPAATIVFGNPRGGTPLMQADPAIAVELPLKAAVVQQRGEVFVVMQNLDRFATHYDLETEATRLGNIQNMIKGLLQSATR